MSSARIDEALQVSDNLRNAQAVGVTQRSATERREPSAHYHGEINIRGIGHHLLLQTARGLVDHQQDHARLEVAGDWGTF